MNTYHYTLFIAFTIIAFMITIDNNVGVYITLIFKLLQSNTQRLFWMIKFHPNNFVTTWIQNRKYDRIARELEKEFQSKVER